jgi:L-malate glycosyltransferase
MKRRVLYLEHHDEIVGGGQVSLLALMGNLQRFEPLCVCGGVGAMARACAEVGVATTAVGMPPLRLPRLGSVLAGGVRLAKLVRRWRAELLHANSSRAMVYASAASSLTGVPVVWHVRTGGSDGGWDWFLGRRARRIIVISRAVALRFGASLVVDTTLTDTAIRDSDAEDLAHNAGVLADAGGKRVARGHKGLADKVRLVHNGVDMGQFSDAGADGLSWRRRLGIGDCPVVGMVAQLVAWKRPDDFIRVASRLKRRMPRAVFVLAGTEPEERGYLAKLQTLVQEEGLEGRFFFLGFSRDVAGIMAMCDVVVLTSKDEPFGRVLIEAMASRRPVVATSGGGVREIVRPGDTGFLAECGDIDGLAADIETLLGDPALAARMGLAGRLRAEKHFSLQTHVGRLERIYAEILDQ